MDLRKDLAKILWAQDSVKENIRTNPNYVHVSSMVDWCPREYALSLRYLKHGVRQEMPTGADRIVWKIGRVVESHIRESLLAAYEPNVCFGRWRCQCGISYFDNVGHPNLRAECCGSSYHYSEYVIQNDRWRITGSKDFGIVENGKLVPIEIKSATDSDNAKKNGKGFSVLKAAMPDHRMQLGLYNLLLEEENLPWPVANYGLVIYGRKEYKYETPYKVFEVDMSRGSIQRTVCESVRPQALTVFDKEHLPKRLCSTPEQTRAKNCEHCQACFTLP